MACLFIALISIATTASRPGAALGSTSAGSESRVDKVVVIGIPGVSWKDLVSDGSVIKRSLPAIAALAHAGASGDVSVRIQNVLSQGYAHLGAGQRVQVDGTGGWAFDPEEQVEDGAASSLFLRRAGTKADPSASVLVPAISSIVQNNTRKAFDAHPGVLAQALGAHGMSVAALGNADLSIGPLPRLLPSPATMAMVPAFESGIHREVALAAMTADGTVRFGRVDRGLLEADPVAPFGIRTSVETMRSTFQQVVPKADLVFIETGDTSRADTYSLGSHKNDAQRYRAIGLKLADEQIATLMEVIDPSRTLVILIAPTTPGGPEERGQLRPAIIAGPGIRHGLMTSESTRRVGLVSMADLTTTIAVSLGVKEAPFISGHPIGSDGGGDRLSTLVDMNTRAVTHDRLRAPISIIVVAATVIIYAIAVWLLRRGRKPRWLMLLLLSALAFPLASFISRFEVWRVGAAVAGIAVVITTVAVAALAMRASSRRPVGDAMIVMGATAAFFLIDLFAGAPYQLDSIFGYTSVAAGRYFGLGNLGFALFAGSAFLFAGMVADNKTKRNKWIALTIVLLLIVADGHPALGDDVGGILSLVPAAIVFWFTAFSEKKIRARYWPLIAVLAVALVLAFGLIDLARPPAARTHLGNFLAQTWSDPLSLWVVIRRKLVLAVSLAISSRWGLAAPGAAGVLMFLHYRSHGAWRTIMASHAGLKAGLEALIVAAVAGSLLNDSGVAVAGTMLTIAAPWALLVLARLKPA